MRRLNGSSLLTLALLVLAASALLGAVALTRRTETARDERGNEPIRYVREPERYARQGHSIGMARSPRRIVEFSDFECPYCKHLHHSLESLQVANPGRFLVVFRHFPIRDHLSSRPAAIAAECAGSQGRFAEYAHTLFAAQDSLGLIPWTELASRAGVANSKAYEQCLADPEASRRVESDFEAGSELRINGTPALLIGDSLYIGDLPVDTLARKLGLITR